ALVRSVDAANPRRITYAPARGHPASPDAHYILDCSGRAGVVARRGWRRGDPRYRTLAIAAEWDCAAWPDDERTQTLVESFGTGWAWSVPLSATRRQCTVMVERDPVWRAPESGRDDT